MVVIQHYFDKRRALATGLAVSGGGVGTLVFGLFAPYLLQNIGWRWTLLYYSGITLLLGVACGMLLKPLPESVTLDLPVSPSTSNENTALLQNGEPVKYNAIQTTGNGAALTDAAVKTQPGCCSGFLSIFSLLLKPSYSMLCFAVLMFSFGYNAPYVYTPDRATQAFGISQTKAASLISIIGIANVGSRLVFGWIGDKNEVVREYMLAIVLTLGGAVSVVIFLFTTYNTLVVYSVLFGMFAGCFVSLFPVVSVDLVGKENVSKSVGLAFAVSSVGALFASPLSGWIIDKTGSFDAPFYVVGAAQTIGGLAFFINVIWRYSYCCKKSSHTYTELPQQQPASSSKTALQAASNTTDEIEY